MTNKKIRGVPRRLRSLKKWSDSFQNYFPNNLNSALKYENWKIPVLMELVEGKQAKQSIKAECAQRLIDVGDRMIKAKPFSAKDFRVTSVICLPDMFTSEVCIYLQDEYFQSHISPNKDGDYQTTRITGRSLAEEWNLSLSKDIQEMGIKIQHINEKYCVMERWYFGEIF